MSNDTFTHSARLQANPANGLEATKAVPKQPVEQMEMFDIPSPCIRVCTTDSRGFCVGCLRNRDERFNWLSFSNEQKRDVIRKCTNRKKRIKLAIYKQRLEKQREAEQQNPVMNDLFGDN